MNTPSTPQPSLPRIAIEYCTGCRWQLRAAWMAQELLTTFEKEVAEVALRPGSGGVFRISIDEQTLWDRKRDGGFPDIKQLKQLVRDQVAPDKTLGHSERAAD
ncbi:SelT/SelW/SelH family protein [Aquitalea palustris]|uniref:SelT/SelW/SelH family protein n=1 Tax=Aquitalea palustris TaxID=2480983 RepID=A0A454JNA2_9NEIS|nr:SelT/SelW/SelH family protein [Aquitalea palustris]RMD01719.1 SelT/SelW/SelH family protein [Aquitalea palustris]